VLCQLVGSWSSHIRLTGRVRRADRCATPAGRWRAAVRRLPPRARAGRGPRAPHRAPRTSRSLDPSARLGSYPRGERRAGYGEIAVEDILQAFGVRSVVLPRNGKPNATRRTLEYRRSFQRLVKSRTGSEGRISCLKRGPRTGSGSSRGGRGRARWGTGPRSDGCVRARSRRSRRSSRQVGAARNTARVAARASEPAYRRARRGSIVDEVEDQIRDWLRDVPRDSSDVDRETDRLEPGPYPAEDAGAEDRSTRSVGGVLALRG
jgi:IS5 family transposase